MMPSGVRNWFDHEGADYARYRPDYPPELARFLAEAAPDTRLAIDVGCGNGQLSCRLAEYFDTVIGLDASPDQIANALTGDRIVYQVAPAERLCVAAQSVSLIAAAQAVHWFNLPQFYSEVRRVAVPGAVIALISYGLASLEAAVNERFRVFYAHELAGHWPAERQLVDSGYADIDFPFHEQPAPRYEIRLTWNASEFLGYISTWSATRRAREMGDTEVLTAFARDIFELWGDPTQSRTITWPIHMRLGVVD